MPTADKRPTSTRLQPGDAADDRRLQKSLLAGRESAVTEFFGRFFRPLYRFALVRLGGNHADCEEIVQETFVAALKSMKSFQGESTLYTWLCGIARFKIYSLQRKRSRGASIAFIPSREVLEALGGIDRQDLPDRVLEREDTARLVQLALSLCPPDHQRVLVDRYFAGQAMNDIASVWGKSPKAIESLLVRARRSLVRAIRRIESGVGKGEAIEEIDPQELEQGVDE